MPILPIERVSQNIFYLTQVSTCERQEKAQWIT